MRYNIQILTYEGEHTTKGFFYEWIKYGKWIDNLTDITRTPLLYDKCAILHWPKMDTIGSYNTEKKIATFIIDKVFCIINNC